jgi:signal transduction histidine kinase
MDDTGRCDECERIAHGLHDTVIQHLFAAGLSLQTELTRAPGDDTRDRDRIESAIELIDNAIRDVRIAIGALQTPHGRA